MAMFDWDWLKAFLAVLDHGSLSAAARKLGISQPTLGRHIASLEESLGGLLFERGRDGLRPTETAIAIADHARAMELQAGALRTAAAGRAMEVAGTVRITASQIVATYLLPPLIAELAAAEPELEIELVPSNDIQNLLRHDADIALRMVEPTQLDLVARRVNTVSMGMYARRDYVARHGAPTGIDDFAGHVVIGYDRSDLVIRGFREQGFEVDRHFFQVRTDDQVAAWELMAAGCGVGFGPNFIAQGNSELIRLELPYEIPGLSMWLVTHREIHTSARIRRVFDFLAAELSRRDL